MFRPLPLVVALLAVGLGGCVTPGVSPIGSADEPKLKPVFFNDMRLTPVAAPRLVSLPFSGSLEDIAAMSGTLSRLDARRTASLVAGEFEMAALWNHYHAKLAAMRVGMNVSTRDAIDQLQRTSGKAFSLAPGALVVLRSGLDEGTQQLSWLNGFDENIFDNALRVDVADVSQSGSFVEALRIINKTLEQANETIKPGSTRGMNTGAGAGIYSGHAATTLGVENVPANIPFALSNGAVLVRRVTPKGSTFMFYNPGNVAAEVPIENLAYVPPPPPLSRLRQEASPIIVNMGESTWAQYVNVYRKTAMERPPAHSFRGAMYGDGPHFGRDGRLTADLREIAEVDRLIASGNNAFTTAARVSQRAHSFANSQACGKVNEVYDNWAMNGRRTRPEDTPGWRPDIHVVPRVQFGGPYAANARISCMDRDLNTHYSQNYFIGENDAVRTAASLLTDQRVADQLRRIDKSNEAANDMLGVVPVVGNVVSAFRCAEPDDAERARLMAKVTNPSVAKSRPFVEYLYDVSTVERNNLFGETVTHYLDCAAAVPLVGTAVKGGALATKGLNAAWKGGGSARFAQMSQALDEASKAVNGYERLEQMASTGGVAVAKAAKTAHSFQGYAQRADNLVDFSNGLESAAELAGPAQPRS